MINEVDELSPLAIVNLVDHLARRNHMAVIPAPTTPTHELGTTRFTSLATPQRGSTTTSVWQVEIAPGTPSTPHALTREEVFVVLAGRAAATWTGSWRPRRCRRRHRRATRHEVRDRTDRWRRPPDAVLHARRRAGPHRRRRDVHATMGGVSDPAALARLFAIAYRSLVDDLHAGLRERGWVDVRPAFGFVLLAARDASTTVSELATLTGTTKQAASKLVDAMVAAGYVERGTDATDGRQRPLTLSDRGRELLATVEEIYAELETRWADVIGRPRVEALRRDLVAVLRRPDGDLPPVRPTW